MAKLQLQNENLPRQRIFLADLRKKKAGLGPASSTGRYHNLKRLNASRVHIWRGEHSGKSGRPSQPSKQLCTGCMTRHFTN